MKRNLRLVTWNVNGLRAVLQRLGQRLQPFLQSFEADIMCFQETKITRSELDQELVRPPGDDAAVSNRVHHVEAQGFMLLQDLTPFTPSVDIVEGTRVL